MLEVLEKQCTGYFLYYLRSFLILFLAFIFQTIEQMNPFKLLETAKLIQSKAVHDVAIWLLQCHYDEYHKKLDKLSDAGTARAVDNKNV